MRVWTRTGPVITAYLAVLGLSACGTAPIAEDPDKWQRVNRSIYNFNVAVDNAIARPAAKGYSRLIGQWFRDLIHNFLSNVSYPLVIVNDLLQAKFKQAGQDTARFLFNSTFGLAGILDPASLEGLEEHDEDFGQTLAVWGVPSGPYIMLPFLGPSTARDAGGGLFEAFFNPLVFTVEGELRIGALLLLGLDSRSRLLGFDEAIANAYDPYAFIRESYLQRRMFLIYDGSPPEDELFEDFDEEEFEDFEDIEDE